MLDLVTPPAATFRATDEQQECIGAALGGRSLKIEAGAGCGKTGTLVAIAEAKAKKHGQFSPEARGQYLAYNRKMADEARERLPKNVKSSTVHGLAYQAVGRSFVQGRLNSRFPARTVAATGGVLGDQIFNGKALSQAAIGYIMQGWVSRFCQSDDSTIGLKHFPTGSFMSHLTPEESKNLGFVKSLREKFATDILEPTRRLWSQMSDISAPLSMLQLATGQECQAIYVGDRYQQLYSWRGAVNAMAEIKTEQEVWLTQSFRFGPEIANVANIILEGMLGAKPRMRGNPNIASRVGMIDGVPDFVLCRTNGSAIEEAVNYVRQEKAVELKGSVTGMVAMVRGAQQLAEVGRTENEALCNFRDYYDLREYVSSGSGGDLKVLVDLIDEYGFAGATELLESLGNKDGQRKIDVAVGTAHGAKGLQWPKVRLAGDFVAKSQRRFTPEEGNILYVAATRAEHELDGSGCEAMQELFRNTEDVEPECAAMMG
jgi:hypothetical protein